MKKCICSFARCFQTGIAVSFFVLLASVVVPALFSPGVQAAIQFQEFTDNAGVSNTTRSYGSSWADFNADGWPDLWTGNHNYGGRLYRNDGDGTFTDVTSSALSKRIDRHGAAWADFDNDGDQDLLVLVGANIGTAQIPNLFFINDNGLLTDEAAARGLDYPLGRGRTPLWFDWNADGNLDVLIVNKKRLDGEAPTALFTQQGGYFTNETFPSLFPVPDDRLSFAQLSLSNACVLDVPVVAIDRSYNYPGRIYGFGASGFQNDKTEFGFPSLNGTITDVAIADFDGDLVNDFYIARSESYLTHKLFVQTSAGVEDATADADLDHPSGGVESVVAADFDNDMDVDFYLVRSGQESNRLNLLYENLGDGSFQVVANAGGAQGSTIGLGHDVTTADFDMDGFVDLFITNGRLESEGPDQLFLNLGNENHWLEIDLVGVMSNRDGIGARIIATVGGVDQLREQDGGMHSKSQNHARIHFGFGNQTLVEHLTIYWPSGTLQEIYNIPTDQVISVIEPHSCSLDPRFVETSLGNGIKYYTNRNYVLTDVPSHYAGMPMIATPNNERNWITSTMYLTFEMPSDSTVYVAYDSRATSLPDWMSGFVDTGDSLLTSLSTQPSLEIYSQSYGEGDCVNLGANKASGFAGGDVSNYIVFFSVGVDGGGGGGGSSGGGGGCFITSMF